MGSRLMGMDPPQPQRRRVTSVRQLELMLEFLDGHRDLALGRIKSKEFRHTADRLWNQLADQINPEGAHRTGKEWAKVWNDQKCKVRNKIIMLRASQNATGGGPGVEVSLTELENRIANIIGVDVGPLPNVMQNQLDPGGGGDDEQDYLQEIIVADTSPPILDDSIPINVEDEQEEEDIDQDIQETPRPATGTRPRNAGGSHEPWMHLSYDEGQGPSNINMPPRTTGQAIRARHERRSERRMRATSQASQSNTSRENENPHASQSNRSCPVDWSREMVLRIENSRAQAELSNARSLGIIAEAIKMFAEAVNAATQLYLNNGNRQGGV